MTPDEITQVAEVVDIAMGRRMEHVYATVEELRQTVADAVEQVRATAEVLYDNDVAVMGEMAKTRGEQPAEMIAKVNDSWARFLRHEAEQLGWRIVVPK